ncbi:hypothetical protein HK097_005526 [Rhizophlyctis rosea]|uniref:F-box domain-containing protein n=1 Tax=Rhizophlyctis rosea TaxID=64517 RepID=A0AAD5X360_9FUNG|nr:hypothetical protein HK097_005526 [Rhizophlyctis rosea]
MSGTILLSEQQPWTRALTHPDILSRIFLYVSHPLDLLKLSSISRLWRTTATSNPAWIPIATNLRPFLVHPTIWHPVFKTTKDAKTFYLMHRDRCCTMCLHEITYPRNSAKPRQREYDREIDIRPCVHYYYGKRVKHYCIGCHYEVFHAETVTRIETLMRQYGFVNEGWDYFAENGWKNRMQVVGDGSCPVKWRGFEATFACSKIVEYKQAEEWIRREAVELGLYDEGGDQDGDVVMQ